MRDLNQVSLMGRLGADPILRQTKSGSSVVNFSLATSRQFPKRAGEAGRELGPDPRGALEFVEETEWHKVVVWGKQGEHCFQYLKKGDPVYLSGTIRSHSYSDQGGVARTAYEIHAEDVNFLGTIRRSFEDSGRVQEPQIVGASMMALGDQEIEMTELSVS